MIDLKQHKIKYLVQARTKIILCLDHQVVKKILILSTSLGPKIKGYLRHLLQQ
jgi:hypothetical protein